MVFWKEGSLERMGKFPLEKWFLEQMGVEQFASHFLTPTPTPPPTPCRALLRRRANPTADMDGWSLVDVWIGVLKGNQKKNHAPFFLSCFLSFLLYVSSFSLL